MVVEDEAIEVVEIEFVTFDSPAGFNDVADPEDEIVFSRMFI